MYGTVARFRVKDGSQQEFERLGEELMRDDPPGSWGDRLSSGHRSVRVLGRQHVGEQGRVHVQQQHTRTG